MIAQGRTSIRAGIDFGYRSHAKIIQTLDNPIHSEMKDLQSEIESITQDSDIDQEEKDTLRNPFGLEQLYLQETYSLINKSIFCAILVFWETSLLGILEFFTERNEFQESKKGNVQTEEAWKAKKKRKGASGYLKDLNFPQNQDTELLTGAIHELRNYFVHGSLSQKRKERIQACLEKHGESGLEKVDDGYSISSANFLQDILELVYKTLCEIEAFCDANSKNKIQ